MRSKDTSLQAWEELHDELSRGRPPPKFPPGFPGLRLEKRKTPVEGGGGLRKRWRDEDGNIYEWDSRHGTVEKFDKRGRHRGELDPETGEQIKPRVPERKVEP